MNRTLRLAVVASFALAAVGCSSSNDTAATTTSAGTVAGSTTTAAGSTTTSTTTAATTTTLPAATTTVPAGPVYPLTGLPVTDAAAAARPALVVKIDNNADARPQNGLNEADIVFEEIVEVQTRFAAVFQSQGADPVGPIRSGRTQDVLLLGSLNHPLFLWSGGNPAVTRAIENSDFVNLSAQRGSVYGPAGFFRSNSRSSPHNLYATTSAAWTLTPAGATPPAQQFQYLAAGAARTGDPASGVNLEMDGLPIEWRYAAASGLYLRSNGGTPHNDVLSGQVSTHNVVVMVVDYQPSAADANSPEAQTIGSGTVLVYTGGVVVQGTWSRPDRLSPIVLTDAGGAVIPLTPGRTFIELVRPGTFGTVA
ncbi:MAG: DUF3048 domain-containing protein [Actinomycetota bacterium]|nr:DUF3048 domain-containing protein [Actinomycetota bacterium]